MKKVLYICMGSACHVKGADEVVKIFLELVEEYNLHEKLELKGSFCLGPCLNAVVLKFEDELITDVKPENARKVFAEKILPRLE